MYVCGVCVNNGNTLCTNWQAVFVVRTSVWQLLAQLFVVIGCKNFCDILGTVCYCKWGKC